jgi:hypothetical protein
MFDFEIFVFSKKKGRFRDHFGHGVTNFGHASALRPEATRFALSL